jgi:hypothetical protein
VEQAIGTDVSPEGYDPNSNLCTYQFFSHSGINTDLVVGPLGGITEAEVRPGHSRVAVPGLGDRAAFYRANTLDDGNSVLIVTKKNRSFILAGEFLTLKAARQLATIVLRSRS